MYRGICCDPGWGPGGAGSPDPGRLAALGVRRVRFISRRDVGWYVDLCWTYGILVRAVVVDGYYCPADEYEVLNEPNLHGMTPRDFATQLQIHRHQYPDKILIAGGLGDALDIGIDGAAYLTATKDAGGLIGYDGVSIHYPKSAPRMAAFKKAAGAYPVHVGEYNVADPRVLSSYLANVIRPYARTADYFCWSDGMRDQGWTSDMGLVDGAGVHKPILRQWMSLT